MKKSPFKIIAIGLATLVVFAFCSNLIGKSESDGFYKNDFSLLNVVKFWVTSEYVDKEIDRRNLEYGAIKGYLAELDDPYTRFLEPKSHSEMKVRMSGEFFGIGIHIGMKDKGLTVISPIEGTPAYKAGLKSLDKIVSIDGDSTKGMSLNEAVTKIRGPKNTKVVLGILREGTKEPFDVDIIRDKIPLKSVDKFEVLPETLGELAVPEKIGYLRLATFESKKADSELADGIKELLKKGAKGSIVDLRYNGGGLLGNAISISSMFLDEGDVVHTVDRNGKKNSESVSGRAIYPKGPLVVLVNQGSASASEIFAGAIKDNERGIIVGRDTFGKASVQKIFPLPDDSAVLITIARYYTPDMVDITKKGIKVDIDAKIPTDNIKMMEETDYKYSIETDYQLKIAVQELLKLISESNEEKDSDGDTNG